MNKPPYKHEAKLRELVEGAGFELAVSLDYPGHFRIMTKDLEHLVALASVSARGFDVAFPATRRRSSTPTDLVDDLEDWAAGQMKGGAQ